MQASRRTPPFQPASAAPSGGVRFPWAYVLLLLLLLAPAWPASAQTPDLAVVIFSLGKPQDDVAVSYSREVSDGEIQADFATLAKELGVPPPKVKISREDGIATAEARLPGLTSTTGDPIRLDPLIQAFRRFGFFQVSAFFQVPFTPPAPGNSNLAGLRVETRVDASAVNHRVWIDQSRGVPDRLPSVNAPPAPDWRRILGLALVALAVAVAVFLIVYIVMGQRRAAAARGRGAVNGRAANR